jgi:hypothetical protein
MPLPRGSVGMLFGTIGRGILLKCRLKRLYSSEKDGNSTNWALAITTAAYELFQRNCTEHYRIRSIGVRDGDLKPSWHPKQSTLFEEEQTV